MAEDRKLSTLNRRRFMGLAGGGLLAGTLLAACGSDDDDSPGPAQSAAPTATQPAAQPAKGTVIVGDVLDHALASDQWKGDFGFVTFKLHAGSVDDQPVYFIRTDASDQAFAGAEKLVYVPLMAEAVKAGGAGLSAIYLFDGGTADQTPVLSTAPHKSDFSPAFRINRVSFTGAPVKLGSVAAITQAQTSGQARVTQTDIVVNYPVVKWPGGEMPVDSEKTAYLGGGQLVSPVDVAGGKVTFKLHSCYPSTRYIVTDVTMPPMATGMNIAPAPGAAALTAAGATAQILVFGNGIEGSGPMGFQKSITDTNVGDAKWSPFWDHYTFLWKDGQRPEVLRTHSALQSKETAALTRFRGTPDTGGELFMVNCPVPVIAPVA